MIGVHRAICSLRTLRGAKVSDITPYTRPCNYRNLVVEQPAGYADFPWILKEAIVPSAGEQSEIDLGSCMLLRICGRLFKFVGATR
jgi:hypothetical protein